MFKVIGGGASYDQLSAGEAARKARALRSSGCNDVEIFKADGTRISQYALEQIVRSGE